MMVVETLHGILRSIFLVPLTCQVVANQIGVAIGSLLVLLIAFLTIKWIGETVSSKLVLIGLLWVSLTFVFEVGLGYAFGGWPRVLMDYDPMEGGLMPLGLLVMLFSPLITCRMRA